MLLGMQANVLHPSGSHAGAVTKAVTASLYQLLNKEYQLCQGGLQFGANVSWFAIEAWEVPPNKCFTDRDKQISFRWGNDLESILSQMES